MILGRPKDYFFLFSGLLFTSHWLNLQHWTGFYHCSLWRFSWSSFFYFWGLLFFAYRGRNRPEPLIFFPLIFDIQCFFPFLLGMSCNKNRTIRVISHDLFIPPHLIISPAKAICEFCCGGAPLDENQQASKQPLEMYWDYSHLHGEKS